MNSAAVAFENTQKINQRNVTLLAGIFFCVYKIIPGLIWHILSELSYIPRVSYSNTRLNIEGVYPFKVGITESMHKTTLSKIMKMCFVVFNWDAIVLGV